MLRKRTKPFVQQIFFRHPNEMRKFLDADMARLYDLIWKRAVASQMQAAEMERTTVEIEAVNGIKVAGLRAIGSVVRFDGFSQPTRIIAKRRKKTMNQLAFLKSGWMRCRKSAV